MLPKQDKDFCPVIQEGGQEALKILGEPQKGGKSYTMGKGKNYEKIW